MRISQQSQRALLLPFLNHRQTLIIFKQDTYIYLDLKPLHATQFVNVTCIKESVELETANNEANHGKI